MAADLTWQIWDLPARALQQETRLWPGLEFPVSGDELASIRKLVRKGEPR